MQIPTAEDDTASPAPMADREHQAFPVLTPQQVECPIPAVFAVGDVRSGSVKRVARAVGEGAAVVAQLHAHRAAQDQRSASKTA